MPDAELREQRIDRSQLHTRAPAGVAQERGVDVVLPIRCDEWQFSESIDDVAAGAGPGEALQQFLEDKAGRHHDVATLQCFLEFDDLRRRDRRIAPEGRLPDPGVHQ